MGYLEMIFALFFAAFLGSIIGIQRQKIGKPAGMRTFALVSLGSALFTMISTQAFEFGDPGRVAAQILVGIGFIGAGNILHTKEGVEGLTTAAGLWVAAAIGMSVGVGWYLQSLLTVLIVMVILLLRDKTFFEKK